MLLHFLLLLHLTIYPHFSVLKPIILNPPTFFPSNFKPWLRRLQKYTWKETCYVMKTQIYG